MNDICKMVARGIALNGFGQKSNRMSMRRSATHGFSLVELLVVIAIIGLLIALLLPAVQAAREAGRNTACKNNLKQIALAMHQYDQVRHRLPPAATFVGDSSATLGIRGTGGSAFLLCLPFLEEQRLYEQYDPQLGPYDGTNINVGSANLA